MQHVNSSIQIAGVTYKSIIQIYERSDDAFLQELYAEWRSLSAKTLNLGGRGINLPDVLSEAIFCRAMNSVRVITVYGTGGSFDAYSLSSKKRIQVKGCSVLPDLTSFGPKSVWDELYFMDFYNDGKWDGTVNIYHIPNELIYNNKQSKEKTFMDMQKEGKRPRFSLFKLITEQKITPIKIYNIYDQS